MNKNEMPGRTSERCWRPTVHVKIKINTSRFNLLIINCRALFTYQSYLARTKKIKLSIIMLISMVRTISTDNQKVVFNNYESAQ